MPPATTAGAAEGKAGAGKKKKRKSLAVDANLLGSGGSGSESDGRRSRPAAASTRGGAGDPGGEDESSNRRIEQRQKDAQSRKPDSQDGQKRAKTKTQVRKAAATGDSGSPSPPTKTMTTTTRPATERERDSTEARPRSKSKAIADDAPKVVPSKRKGRPESSQPTSASIHPTPPLTDPPDEAADAEGAPQQRQRRKGDAETSKSSQAVEGTDGSLQNGKAKKTKTAKVAAAREERPPSRSNLAHPEPTGRRNPSSDDDDFVFVRLDATAKSVKQAAAISHAADQSAEASTSTAQPAQARQSSKRPEGGVAARASQVGPSASDAGVDRKGKRKADPAIPSASSNESRQQDSRPTAVAEGGKERSKQERAKAKGRKDESRDGCQMQDTAERSRTPTRYVDKEDVPMASQETPAIRRNQAFRAGLGPPPGATPGTLARRASGELRGRRGSSIGNGFEALPHPSLPTHTLYRHIKADDPPAIRFRTLVTWSTHRLKEAMDESTRGKSAAVRLAANTVIDALIADLAEKKIDLSWPADEYADAALQKADLPPHSENVANQAKLEACTAWTDRLAHEDKTRNARINQYKVMTEAITKLTNVLPAAAQPAPDSASPAVADILKPNFTMPIPSRLQTKDEILSFGRILLQPKLPPSSASSRRKSVAASEPTPEHAQGDPDEIRCNEELPNLALDDLRHRAASMHQTIHRVNQFLETSDKYLDRHLEQTRIALGELMLGAGSASADAGGARSAAGAQAASGDTAASGGDHGGTSMGLQLRTGAAASLSAQSAARRSLNPRDLLRAISRADTATAKAASGTSAPKTGRRA